MSSSRLQVALAPEHNSIWLYRKVLVLGLSFVLSNANASDSPLKAALQAMCVACLQSTCSCQAREAWRQRGCNCAMSGVFAAESSMRLTAVLAVSWTTVASCCATGVTIRGVPSACATPLQMQWRCRQRSSFPTALRQHQRSRAHGGVCCARAKEQTRMQALARMRTLQCGASSNHGGSLPTVHGRMSKRLISCAAM